MNHLAKYLTMKIIPREYENDLDQIELQFMEWKDCYATFPPFL